MPRKTTPPKVTIDNATWYFRLTETEQRELLHAKQQKVIHDAQELVQYAQYMQTSADKKTYTDYLTHEIPKDVHQGTLPDFYELQDHVYHYLINHTSARDMPQSAIHSMYETYRHALQPDMADLAKYQKLWDSMDILI